MVYRMETLSTKVPPSMKERIEDHAERIGETRSTAIRELLQTGLDDAETSYQPHHLAALFGAFMLGSVAIPASSSMAVYMAIAGLLLLAGGLAWPTISPRLSGRVGQ